MLRSMTFARATVAILTVFSMGGVVAFGHSGFYGEYGLLALRGARHQERVMRMKKAALETERARLENLVGRLGTERLDLDLLDEQARRVLGYSRNDEIIIR